MSNLKNPPKPLAPHVQKCLNGPAAQVQAMMVRGHTPAPHVQAAIQRCQSPVPQARRGGVVAPASVQALAQPSRHTRAIQRARSTVIQRSESQVVSFDITVAKGEDSPNLSSTEVKMNNQGNWAYAPLGIHTKGVRNCVALCIFSSQAVKPLPKIYMHHSPWYELMPDEAWKVVKDWESGFKGYIIGGNDMESFATSKLEQEGWSKLNIVGVMSPLTQEGRFANIEAKGTTITYWVYDD
ncbi:MAG TPA: hypothetical protein VF789_27250 [Thermoanaerobaculia bacterium]